VKHVIHFSTGTASAEVAKRVIDLHGTEATILLTADTLKEDEDNWRFAKEVVAYLDSPEWVILCDGRTPMEVGRDERCVPNNRMAVCSKILKRELLDRWTAANCRPEDVHYLGYDWTEEDRWDAALPHWKYPVAAPLREPPRLSKPDILALWRSRGIEPPRLYALGFHHANCGGFCVRGGQAQWELGLRVNRAEYLRWEADEETSRTLLGKDVSILRDRTKGTSKPLPLRVFRERLDQQPSFFDADEWGACGCMP
jgi:hypothetical protein